MQIRSGFVSSEFALSVAVVALAAVSDILVLVKEHSPASAWVGGAIAVVSTVLAVLKAMGYSKDRTALKETGIRAAVEMAKLGK